MSTRWDAVVECAALGCGTPPLMPRPVTERSTSRIEVDVRLFGALGLLSAEQPVRLSLPGTATIADVLAMLGKRLGAGFLGQVLDATGAKRRYCRLFVGGYAIEDLQTTLNTLPDPSEIAIILLIALEGG